MRYLTLGVSDVGGSVLVLLEVLVLKKNRWAGKTQPIYF
jgi:hypothetical protein